MTAFVTTVAASAAGGVTGAAGAVAARVRAMIDGESIRVFAILERDQQIQGEMWAFPKKVTPDHHSEDLVAAASDRIDEFRVWARRQGGVDVSVTTLKLIIEGRSDRQVRVIGMRAVVDERQAPLTGALFFASTQAGADITQIGFNLDENDPVARTVEMGPGPYADDYFGAPYFSAKQTKTLGHGDQEVFQVTARTLRSFIKWHIQVKLLVGGQEETVEVRPAGKNIGTTALRQNAKGAIRFADYQALYAWDFERRPNGFVRKDPKSFTYP